MTIIFRWIMILIVEGWITRGPMHHACRLSVHHVAHRRFRTVCTAWTCGQWWKRYTLLQLELCSVIGRRQLDMHVESFSSLSTVAPLTIPWYVPTFSKISIDQCENNHLWFMIWQRLDGRCFCVLWWKFFCQCY